jgi:hypothetical protein
MEETDEEEIEAEDEGRELLPVKELVDMAGMLSGPTSFADARINRARKANLERDMVERM